MCQSANLFFEARGEPLSGQWRVLDVVRNRVANKNYPNTHCGNIIKPYQFSWYNDHKVVIPDDPLFWGYYIVDMYSDDVKELAAWERSKLYASLHNRLKLPDSSYGSLYYMTLSAYDKRGRRGFNNTTVTLVDGDHIFLKPCKRDDKCTIYTSF